MAAPLHKPCDEEIMKYKVRDNYVVHLGADFYRGGEVVELDAQQAAGYANIIEPAEPEKPAKAKAAAKAE
jgi:hypothetical protein